MKQVTFDAFLSAWEQKLSRPMEELFCIYVANPFCSKKCRFCMYGSTQVTRELYDRYYGQYLPHMIGQVRPLLEKRTPDTYYFGGGTASLMTPKTMVDIFSRFPNFRDTGHKLFEAHPTSTTREKIDILADFGFDAMSMGIQTFDPEVLRRENRENPTIEQLAELVGYAAEKGIFVNIDLLTYYEDASPKNLELLAEDLQTVAGQLQPGKMTVYPRYETYRRSTEPEQLRQIRELRLLLQDFSRRSGYRVTPETVQTEDPHGILAYGIQDYHLYNPTSRVSAPRVRYNCSGPGSLQGSQNVLGLGGYRTQAPYSYIWQEKQWYIANLKWEPTVFEGRFNDTASITLQFD